MVGNMAKARRVGMVGIVKLCSFGVDSPAVGLVEEGVSV